MINLVRAANVPNAGAHWIVVPDGTTAYLCLATVGNHENPPSDVWPTWWNTDQAGSTITVKEDMVVSQFEKQRAEANYVLLTADFELPTGEIWTENKSTTWENDNNAATVMSDDSDAADHVVNDYSLKVALTAPP